MLRSDHGAQVLHGRHGGCALQRFLQQTWTALQRTELLGNDDAVHVAGEALETAALASGENQRPSMSMACHEARYSRAPWRAETADRLVAM